MTKKSNRGGLRNPPGGRPPLPPDQIREKHTVRLAPGTKALAQAIAKERGLPGWGKLLDELVRGEAELMRIKIGDEKMFDTRAIYNKSAFVNNMHGLRFFIDQCPNPDFKAEGLACLNGKTQADTNYLTNLIPQDHPDRIGLFRWLTEEHD